MVKAVFLTDSSKPTTGYTWGIEVNEFHPPILQPEESLIKIQGFAFNHHELGLLKNEFYQEIIPGTVLGADGVGILQKKGTASVEEGQRVLIYPSMNWDSDPLGPGDDYRNIGLPPYPGTFAETINVDSKQVFACPNHLTTAEAAALPLAGLTAYRAVFTKSQVKKGDFVLVTGIGGGVAITALQLAVAAGAHVYVTSGSDDKIEFAKKLGAEGGVNYKQNNAIEELKRQLNGNLIKSIIDGSGGALFDDFHQVLATGGFITHYGNTASRDGVRFPMNLWVRNIELKGTIMGSRIEFGKMLEYISEHKIRPVVSASFKGITQENLDKAIELLDNHQRLGKVVVEV